jgi:glycosyltransferase involved in cell wall biosynthesis
VPNGREQPLRVAFYDIANPGWTAGAHYYENLFVALRSLDGVERPRIVLVVPRRKGDGAYHGYRHLADEIVEVPPATRTEHYVRRISRVMKTDPLASRRLDSTLRAEHIDLVFMSWGEFEAPVGTPLLGWIHDFQHSHLPDLFSAKELRQRDDRFARLSDASARVVLSSEDARRDFARFLPAYTAKARVMRFVAQVPPGVYDADPGWICDEYHLPERFVYLPNQFWVHKGHRLVLEALAQLQGSHPEVVVVCTGNPADNRAPRYFGELIAEVSRRGLREHFVVLGWVPHAHIYPLVRQSLAVLQPSRFEGWSTTVEETKSVGKTMLLSDIPVHREQSPAEARYFDPTDAAALAQVLATAYETLAPGPAEEMEQRARTELPGRTRDYAETFVRIAKDAVEHQST